MKFGGHRHSIHCTTFHSSTLSMLVLALRLTSHGHRMAATAPGITSSHHQVQNRKGAKELFLLWERNVFTMKHTSTHHTLWRVLFLLSL